MVDGRNVTTRIFRNMMNRQCAAPLALFQGQTRIWAMVLAAALLGIDPWRAAVVRAGTRRGGVSGQ